MMRRRSIRIPEGCDPAIAHLVRALNDNASLTVEALAERSGVNHSTIWNWICGRRAVPNISNLRAALNALGYDLKVVRKP